MEQMDPNLSQNFDPVEADPLKGEILGNPAASLSNSLPFVKTKH